MKRLLHRLWRRLPRAGRRWLFVLAQAALTPGRRPATAKLPVVIGGVVRSATGLGESARMNVDGVRHAGLPFAVLDLSDSFLGPPDAGLPSLSGTVPAAGPGSLILHVSGPFIPYALRHCGRALVRDKYVIGFWHWELPRLPADWRVGLNFVHEVWVPSRFCADAVRHDYDGPIRVIPHPVEVEAITAQPSPDRRFTALAMFNMSSGFERKNPLAAVRAFKLAFGEDPAVRLQVKVQNGASYAAGLAALRAEIGAAGNIELIDRSLSRRQTLELIAAADVVLSLHRSEGFGLLAAEAMLIGVPVIATDWSATTDFVTPETGLPIPYRLVPAVDEQGWYNFPSLQWADPDVEAAAAALHRLRAEPALRHELAGRGRKAARELFSLARYEAAILEALSGAP